MRIELATEEALLTRLGAPGASEFVFLVGSALVAPLRAGEPGVPWAKDMVGLVRNVYRAKPKDLQSFDEHLSKSSTNQYQAAFTWLLDTRGADEVARVIRDAVSRARVGRPTRASKKGKPDYHSFENDPDGWHLQPGIEALGQLIAQSSKRFGQVVLTTNFDPLIEISIKRAHGNWFRTVLQGDGSLHQATAPGCNVVHLHGDWLSTDTLHSPSQLTLDRPHLRASLAGLLRERTLVILGYGGWDDVLTQALRDLACDGGAKFDILWAFHGTQRAVIQEENEALLGRIADGIQRGRIRFYGGIDAHKLLPRLLKELKLDQFASAAKVSVETDEAPRRLRPPTARPKSTVGVHAQTTGKVATAKGRKPATKKDANATLTRIPQKGETTLAVSQLTTGIPQSLTTSATPGELFAEAVRPFHVLNLSERTHGIDGFVEVVRSTEGRVATDATGKRFAFKVIEIDKADPAHSVLISVNPDQVRYWIANTEPVLLVACHPPTQALYWRWIDDGLADELTSRDPSWFGQETVLIHVPTADDTGAPGLAEIERYVRSFGRSGRPLLVPGMYMRIHEKAKHAAAELVRLSQLAGFESVCKRLGDLERRLRHATYVVAIAGPARAGKSTLINALLGLAVSPVGKLPTTAVTILATAGDRNEAEIIFTDGRRQVGPADAAFLAQYATIDQNPDNKRGVRLVNVQLINAFLELGVSLLDAPGLHDPSEEIRKITDAALRTAHAVLYVLDVSPARTGGFSVSDYVLKDLQHLHTAAERLFVVLNKDDELTPEDREAVKGHVEQTLRKYGVWEHLPQPPMFISGGKAWEWRQHSVGGPSPIGKLEEAVWSHLLKTSSTGWDRLRAAATELTRGAKDFVTLLQTRRAAGAEAGKLMEWLEMSRKKEGELVARCRARVQRDYVMADACAQTVRAEISADLGARLGSIALNAPLPSTDVLKKEIVARLQSAFLSTWQQGSADLEKFSGWIGGEIEQTLQQARLVIGAPPGMRFVTAPLPDFGNSNELASPEAMAGLFWGGLLGLLLAEVSPALAPLIAASGWFTGLLLGKEGQRKRAIGKILSSTDKYVASAISSFLANFQTRSRRYSEMLIRHVDDRMAVFVKDLKVQLDMLGTPLTAVERTELEDLERQARDTLGALEAVVCEISATHPVYGDLKMH